MLEYCKHLASRLHNDRYCRKAEHRCSLVVFPEVCTNDLKKKGNLTVRLIEKADIPADSVCVMQLTQKQPFQIDHLQTSSEFCSCCQSGQKL